MLLGNGWLITKMFGNLSRKIEFMKTKINQCIKWAFLGLLLVVSVPFAQAQKTPSEIYRETSPAVVLLLNSNPGSSTRFKGTGFIIKRRLILTNAHVVLNDNNQPLGPSWLFYHLIIQMTTTKTGPTMDTNP